MFWRVANNQVKITNAGQAWLKKQLQDFRDNNRQDALYRRGGQRVDSE